MSAKIKYSNTKYKCLYCDDRYTRIDLIEHINDEHEDYIPEGYSAVRVVYDYINKKPTGYNGKCTECGGPTRWDENKARYDRQCQKQACKDSYKKKFEENMIRSTGVSRISQTAEGQKKMLANRKISGYYTFRDGVKKPYCGSYEKNALEFMDKVMNINSYDIECPGPILEYTYEGKVHMYITDFFYQPYNLIIEVKDGGDNPNRRNMPEYRAKQIAKEQYIIKHTNYNYIRLTDNKLNQLIAVMADLKMQLIDNTNDRVIHVNENTPVHEFMNALMSGRVPGIADSDAYIVNYSQNNTFSSDDDSKFAITNSRDLTNLIAIDKDGIVKKFLRIDELDIKESKVYKLNSTIQEVSKRFRDRINTKMTESELYELATGDKLIFEGQIDKQLERVESSAEYSSRLKLAIESSFDCNKKENDIDKLEKSINEVKSWISLM